PGPAGPWFHPSWPPRSARPATQTRMARPRARALPAAPARTDLAPAGPAPRACVQAPWAVWTAPGRGQPGTDAQGPGPPEGREWPRLQSARTLRTRVATPRGR